MLHARRGEHARRRAWRCIPSPEPSTQLRGGDLDRSIIRRDAQRIFDIYGTYGISVFALRGATIVELAQEAPLVRFPHFTVMTVRTIRVLGLRLEPTGRNHRHYTLVLRSLDEDVAALVSADHHVWMNPYHEA